MANETQGQIIIGHTTDHSARVWFRGEERRRWVQVRLDSDADGSPVEFVERKLDRDRDFTGVEEFTGLGADTPYAVEARFARRRSQLKRDPSPAKGRVRTFPAANSETPFSFLHGSCNLSTVRLMHAGGLAAGTLGALFAMVSLMRGGWFDKLRWYRHKRSFGSVLKASGFEQSTLKLSSPFDRLARLVTTEGPDQPRFMIHAGDQIYFDFPFSGRRPSTAAYRRTYRQTWFEDPEVRGFLSQCPHYMMLDDHDIVDGFANDRILPGIRPREHRKYLGPAKKAYREYVDLRHPSRKPDGAVYYDFGYGPARFFVMDTRTKRYLRQEQMIDCDQMEALKQWLCDHNDALKFVVSSVAFVAELRPDRGRRSLDSRDGSRVDPAIEERMDKWCGLPYRKQREEILQHVLEKQIGRLVFLVGDMHCAYHATMRVGHVGQGLTLHELAGGPVYQLRFASRRDFYDECRGTITSRGRPYPYATSLRRIEGATSSVLHIKAWPSEVRWRIVPTRGGIEPAPAKDGPGQAAAWDGRISF